MSKPLYRLLAVLAVVATLATAPIIWAKTPAAPAPAVAGNAPASDNDSSDVFKQLTLFSDVLERVRADYVDPVTDDKLIEAALNGMLSSLDPHSSYLNKKNFQDMQTQTKGEFGGLGIEVTMENGIVKVISPIDDTPAAKAGIQSGDFITHIDTKPVTELTLAEAVDKMRGTPGTKITLTIRRGGLNTQPFDVTLTRAVIHIQSVRWEPKGNVAYIRITAFNEQTQSGLDKALTEADEKIGPKLEGYVIDLRNNPGGLLEQAVSVSGTFLEAGKEVVSTRSRHKEEDQSFTAKGGDKAHGKPMAVLINGGSASASEIVAGALQDHKRAILVGTKSFGKGSVQTIIPVAGGGAMRLTTARYFTPSGRSIQALGIEPDIAVQPAKLEKLAMGPSVHEADLKGALQNPDKDKAGAATTTQPSAAPTDPDDFDATAPDAKGKPGDKDAKKDEPPFDYQLARALDLIRGIHLFEVKGGAK
ncbi:MAG TPA: S41 family peptidase [Alphaproteobacteria bacterium]|nr:S41 family peptidase [Alphaproteobacteria bacterium]